MFDSDEIIELPRLPRSLTAIGAGVIGVEYATIFNALDVAVTLIDSRAALLDFVDRKLIDEFVHDLRDRNIALRLGCAVTAICVNEAGRVVTTLANGRSATSEMLLFAAGRVGATDGGERIGVAIGDRSKHRPGVGAHSAGRDGNFG